MLESKPLWGRYCEYLCLNRRLEFSLDISRMRFDDAFMERMSGVMKEALASIKALEGGAIANADENRMVGHYWLRNPTLAPSTEIATQIRKTFNDIKDFAEGVQRGLVRGAGGPFENLLVVGIGGSALGPQFISHALAHPTDSMTAYYFDNTDPDGMDKTLARIGNALDRTLVLVVSKSGGTPETRNGMLEAKRAYELAGLSFAKHAVAVTQHGSQLDQQAVHEEWIARFPMWDWVGGRTSVMSAVGLLPAALQGIDIEEFLAGAVAMDEVTRKVDIPRNPAALLALMWYHAGNGRGEKDMVVLPYKDRLELFSRYLQQLVMESLGKETDRKGRVVHQGIAVYGNKGSTDQHAYVQQLRDGVNNFFVTFIEVLHDRDGASVEVEPGITAGDYLSGLYQGTRKALYDNSRESITITIDSVTPSSVGKLIALFERAVGLYAELVDINAYHQPGVEAGKKAARAVIDLQHKAVAYLREVSEPQGVEDIAAAIGHPEDIETIFKTLEHLAANPERGIISNNAGAPSATLYRAEK